MKVSAKERKHQRNQAMRGGAGEVLLELVPEEKLPAHVRLAATITLAPGCSIGSHAHVGETEMYTFVSGTGMAEDNGSRTPVAAGDVLLTGAGATHGVENTGESDLVFTAVIVTEA
jgi:mannose-6-phosphate isomerase-like protein (cupin superfamily)